MKLKSLFLRLLFCLPFIAVVFYIHSYHGELINNAQVKWQYLQDDEGKLYLALDVYSPSGIKIHSIYSDKRKITDSWRLINYPDWYKGKENFKDLNQFQKALNPYLPYNKDFSVLYTNGWYTFLYEWNPKPYTLQLPLETSLKIKYQNIATENYYNAEHVCAVRIFSEIAKPALVSPVIKIQILLPLSFDPDYLVKNKVEISLDNLISSLDQSGFILKDAERNDYGVYIWDKGVLIDSLQGFIKPDPQGASHVYSKLQETDSRQKSNKVIDFGELLRHIAALIFMVYFAIICWSCGRAFIKWRGIILDSYATRMLIPAFLGIILLTYLFFIIGILQLLYLPVLFVILLTTLFFGFEPSSGILGLKTALINELLTIKKAPWRAIFWFLLLGALFYNLSYCFVPAAYPDGSGDIVNSYLPNINDYILSHSFNAPVYNSNTGINSQAIDTLRTVAKIFAGEPAVYLLSFIYLLLILGGVYLIAKEFFKLSNAFIYLTIFLVLSGYLYTETLHLGKTYLAILAFLLISIYSIRFSDHKKNYILAAVFFGFLISYCPFFIMPALACYIYLFVYAFYKCRNIKDALFKIYAKSFMLFCALSSIFYLKLIFEVGIFFCPGMMSIKLRDIFLSLNRKREFYKYIDNNYIRYFYYYWGLVSNPDNLTLWERAGIIFEKAAGIDFAYILAFIPFLWRGIDKYKIFYILELAIIILALGILNPFAERLQINYIFLIIILQFAIVNAVISRIKGSLSAFIKGKPLFICKIISIPLILTYVFFPRFPFNFEFRNFKWVDSMYMYVDYRQPQLHPPKEWFYKQVLPVFIGKKSKYAYLKEGSPYIAPSKNFDHCMLVREYTNPDDTILIIPVRFHSYAFRHITARHALGSVIYQRDIAKIMADLKKLNIKYLSVVPIHYPDYNPFYTPVFEDKVFYKYFKLLFSGNGSNFYKIIYDGGNTEYSPPPYDVRGLPFIPMLKEGEGI